jgi:hypothetical protein
MIIWGGWDGRVFQSKPTQIGRTVCQTGKPTRGRRFRWRGAPGLPRFSENHAAVWTVPVMVCGGGKRFPAAADYDSDRPTTVDGPLPTAGRSTELADSKHFGGLVPK